MSKSLFQVTTVALTLIVALLISLGIYINIPFISSKNSQIYMQFLSWKSDLLIQYGEDEDAYRFIVFKDNWNIIQQHNNRAQKGLQSYWMGLNQFSGLSDQQFMQLYLNNQVTYESQQKNEISNKNGVTYVCTGTLPPQKEVPDQFDWVAKSIITPVRESSPCQSAGYAIATIQSIQSARMITSGKLIELSAQQLLDCSAQFGNNGCIKGEVTNSFSYIKKYGVASQKKYPYRGFSYNCSYTSSLKQTQILGCVKVTPHKQASIKNAVYRQPLAVAINGAKLKNYAKGIFDTNNTLYNQCKTDPNHWMLMVGYGRDESAKKNYWKLKNSWGIQWGMQGYLYIVRKGDGDGECGVQSQLYYPIA